MRYGPISLIAGALAMLCAVTAWHAARFRMPGSGHILNWLDAHGFVKAPNPNKMVELSNQSPIPVNDGGAIQWILLHSWWFAAAAMLLALWADHNREDTLYLSAGFISGAMALSFFSFSLGIGTMLVGGLAALLLRGRRNV